MTVWTIVAFDHPYQERSVLYRQHLTLEQLFEAIRKADEKGANLISIRGHANIVTIPMPKRKEATAK